MTAKLTPVCRDAARADAICNQVDRKGGKMEPYEQGAWTWCVGMPRGDNPYLDLPRNREWNRGWDEEALAHQEDEGHDYDT